MAHFIALVAIVTAVVFPTSLSAQTGQGSLRGYVRDAQGGALPGVTVTATSPDAIRPVSATTDSEGYYRLTNLPPGTYSLTAELTGFSTFKREGVLLRAGANFQVDIELPLGTLQETITVTGDTPMLEVAKPGNVLNIDGEFQKELPIDRSRALLAEAFHLPTLVDAVLHEEPKVRALAHRYHTARNFLFLGRGANYPTALEGALKLKELSYIHAEGTAAGEMKHGTNALIDEDLPVVAIALKDSVYKKMRSNMEEVRARAGVLIAVANDDDTEIAGKAEEIIRIPRTDELLEPVLAIIPLQLLAYHIADRRGNDVDQPRNLAKSVTVE
jgi:hypothetical protein